MKKILIILFITSISSTLFAQEEGKSSKPDIPGTLLIDLGFNFLNNAPESMDTKFFGSKTINLYYQYEFPIGESKFSFNPGIGIGVDKYSFDKPVGIFNSAEEIITGTGDDQVTTYNHSVSIESLANNFPRASSFDKSSLSVTYLDVPLEFRFNTNPDDKSRSFKVGLGARIGLRLSSKAKVKYKEDGNTVRFKNKQNFDMNSLRYGASARVGIGWFNLFYYHNLSDLFKTAKGPTPDTAITNYTVGLTISGF